MIITVAMLDHWRRGFFGADDWARLESSGTVRVLPEPLVLDGATLAGTEVLITGWDTPVLSEATVAGCPDLRAVIHAGGSVRRLVERGVYDRGVVVSSQAGLNAIPVAQFCLAEILLALKGARPAERLYRATRQLAAFGNPLGDLGWSVGAYGATVGLIGYGRICACLIELLRPHGLRLLLASPYPSAEQAREWDVELVSLAEAMRADVVSVHLGDTQDNWGAISGELLALMPDGATLINTARGIVVDQAALVAELVTGRINAILDVTWPELPAPDSPLWTLPNVSLTPHWAGSLGRELTRLGRGVVVNVEEYLAGRPLTGAIDPDLADFIA